MDSKPLSVAFVAGRKDAENVVLRFAASNGHSYSLILSPAGANQSAKALRDFDGLREAEEIVTNPTDNRQGLVVHTREGTTISLQLSEGAIHAVEACLEATLARR